MKYWVISRKINKLQNSEDDKNFEIHAKLIFFLVFFAIAISGGLFIYVSNVINIPIKLKPIIMIVVFCPPFIIVFILIDAFRKMKNSSG